MIRLPSGLILCLALMPLYRFGSRNIEGTPVMILELQHESGEIRPIVLPYNTEEDRNNDVEFLKFIIHGTENK